MVELAFRVEAWVAWEPGPEGGWRAGPASSLGATAVPSEVPVILRRRVGELGRNALRAAWGLAEGREARFVFASRHGEFDRTVELLRMLVAHGLPSPAAFSLSVHNALAGLLSVANENRGGHTAISAGADSFCYGLLEAACCLVDAPAEPVVLVFYDAPLPSPYDELPASPAEPTIVLALLLRAIAAAAEPAITLSREAVNDGEAEGGAARRFLDFIMSDAGSGDYVGHNARWRWRHVQVH